MTEICHNNPRFVKHYTQDTHICGQHAMHP